MTGADAFSSVSVEVPAYSYTTIASSRFGAMCGLLEEQHVVFPVRVLHTSLSDFRG